MKLSVNGYRNNCEWIIFSFIVLKYLWVDNFFLHSFALRFLLPSSLKLRLNASSKHGDTLPSVFSINKKNLHFFSIVPFRLKGVSNPGRRITLCTIFPILLTFLRFLRWDLQIHIFWLQITYLATPKLAIFEQWRPDWRSGGRQFGDFC